MNHEIDREKLLDDVLEESGAAELREAMLGEALRLARRRRRIRVLNRAGGAVASLLALIFIAISLQAKREKSSQPLVKAPSEPTYQVVSTAPLEKEFVVETSKVKAVQEFSTIATVSQIATVAQNVQFIDDDQLLAFNPGLPKVLIRTGPDAAEIVFSNPRDNLIFGASEGQ